MTCLICGNDIIILEGPSGYLFTDYGLICVDCEKNAVRQGMKITGRGDQKSKKLTDGITGTEDK